MNNNIKDLFTFYFGPAGTNIMDSRGTLNSNDLGVIISNYTLGEVKQVIINLAEPFNLQIGEESTNFTYNLFEEVPELAMFAQVSREFQQQIHQADVEISLQITPPESSIIEAISEIMADAILSELNVTGKDPLVEYLMKLKDEKPEVFHLFKTYRQYRQTDWTRITSSASNRHQASDKIQAIAASLINLKVNAFDHIASLQKNLELSYKDYVKATREIKEHSSSVMSFLNYLLINRQTYSLNI